MQNGKHRLAKMERPDAFLLAECAHSRIDQAAPEKQLSMEWSRAAGTPLARPQGKKTVDIPARKDSRNFPFRVNKMEVFAMVDGLQREGVRTTTRSDTWLR
jgi:hypothetical protein